MGLVVLYDSKSWANSSPLLRNCLSNSISYFIKDCIAHQMEHLGKAFGGTDLLNIYLKGLFGYVLSFSILDTLKANKNKKKNQTHSYSFVATCIAFTFAFVCILRQRTWWM